MVFDLMLFDNNGWGNQFEKNVNVWLLKWFFSKKKKKTTKMIVKNNNGQNNKFA